MDIPCNCPFQVLKLFRLGSKTPRLYSEEGDEKQEMLQQDFLTFFSKAFLLSLLETVQLSW